VSGKETIRQKGCLLKYLKGKKGMRQMEKIRLGTKIKGFAIKACAIKEKGKKKEERGGVEGGRIVFLGGTGTDTLRGEN